jgi:hypothetical protein
MVNLADVENLMFAINPKNYAWGFYAGSNPKQCDPTEN